MANEQNITEFVGDQLIAQITEVNSSRRRNGDVTYPKWSNDTVERLILYADIMGFKDRVLSNDISKLKEDLESFIQAWQKKMEPLHINKEKLHYVQFSDSILIVVNGVSYAMFNLLTKAAECLMYNAFKHGLPIKGVIAQGQFSFDEERQLFFGRPLVQAALLYEEFKYYGIVVHHTAEKTIKEFWSRENPYSNTQIPLEKGKTSQYHLCWNLVDQYYQLQDKTDEYCLWLDAIAETVSGKPRAYIDATKEVFNLDKGKFDEINNKINKFSKKVMVKNSKSKKEEQLKVSMSEVQNPAPIYPASKPVYKPSTPPTERQS